MQLKLNFSYIGVKVNLQDFNPWWKTGKVSPEFSGRKRKIFDEVIKYIDKRQIVLFTGLRRVGKTTLMYQIIEELIKKDTDPYHILYFSFDEMRCDLEEIIKQYETEVLQDDISKKKVYIFLDEIQKLEGWPSKVKLLYDSNPKLKIFLTGSAQITMWQGTRESLAGRFFDFIVLAARGSSALIIAVAAGAPGFTFIWPGRDGASFWAIITGSVTAPSGIFCCRKSIPSLSASTLLQASLILIFCRSACSRISALITTGT
jgi:hypothetical protein